MIENIFAIIGSARCKAIGGLSWIEFDFHLNPHNHNVEYKSDIIKFQNGCKKLSKHSQSNLRKIFNDTTRTNPSACDISLTEIESSCI